MKYGETRFRQYCLMWIVNDYIGRVFTNWLISFFTVYNVLQFLILSGVAFQIFTASHVTYHLINKLTLSCYLQVAIL